MQSSRVVEGRVGIAGFLALYGESLALLRTDPGVRRSLVRWTLLGFVATEGFAVPVANLDSHRAALAAGLAGLGWWLLVSLAFAGGAVWLRRPDGERVHFYGIPNGLTALRAYSCLPLILCATLPLGDDRGLILWIVIGGAAGMLDAVDGWIARRFGPITELGKAFDPAGDALFFAMAAVGNWQLGIVPGWLAGLMLARYVGPLVATPLVFLARRRPELVYTRWGRLNTMLTGVVLFVCMLVRVTHGPVDAVALAVGAPLLGGTTVLHVIGLVRRTLEAPVVRPRRGRATPA
jgi:phosphatidylglycerophosphate synthase